MQQRRLSVSEASSEGHERNGGNVLKARGGFGEGRNEQGKGRGVGMPGVPLSTVSQFPYTGGRFGCLS